MIKKGISPTRAWYFNDVIMRVIDLNTIFGSTEELPIVKEYSKEFVPLSYLKKSEVRLFVSYEVQVFNPGGTQSIMDGRSLVPMCRILRAETLGLYGFVHGKVVHKAKNIGLYRITGIYVVVT